MMTIVFFFFFELQLILKFIDPISSIWIGFQSFQDFSRSAYSGGRQFKYPQSSFVSKASYGPAISKLDTKDEPEKQPTRAALKKKCSENMQQIYMRHPCRSVISIKLQSNFTEITLRFECSFINLLHIFKTSFPKNISSGLLLGPHKSFQNLEILL